MRTDNIISLGQAKSVEGGKHSFDREISWKTLTWKTEAERIEMAQDRVHCWTPILEEYDDRVLLPVQLSFECNQKNEAAVPLSIIITSFLAF